MQFLFLHDLFISGTFTGARRMSSASDFGIFVYDSVLAADHVFGLDLLVFTRSWELASESQLRHKSLTGFWDL